MGSYRFHIGDKYSEPQYHGLYFIGLIDEFRVSKGRARYHGAFDPSGGGMAMLPPFTPDAWTSLMLHGDGDFRDSSANNHVVVGWTPAYSRPKGATVWAAKFGPGVLQLNSKFRSAAAGQASGYVEVADSADFALGGGAPVNILRRMYIRPFFFSMSNALSLHSYFRTHLLRIALRFPRQVDDGRVVQAGRSFCGEPPPPLQQGEARQWLVLGLQGQSKRVAVAVVRGQ